MGVGESLTLTAHQQDDSATVFIASALPFLISVALTNKSTHTLATGSPSLVGH